MSRVVLEFNPRFVLTTIALLIVLTLSVYTITLDYNTAYEWYYPLDQSRVFGVHYPKYEKILLIYDLSVNETIKISQSGLSLGGLTVSPSNSSFIKLEYRGVNAYVLFMVSVVLIAEVYGYLKMRKASTGYAFLLFVVLTAISLIALVTMIYYVNMGTGAGYTLQQRPLHGRLVGPIDVKNITGLEKIPDLSRLLELFRYVYACPRQSLSGFSIAVVNITAPTALTIPIIRIGDNIALSYNSASYASRGEAWCALFSITEVNASYTIHIVEFQSRPAEEIIPLVSTLPLALTLMSLSLAIALGTHVKKQKTIPGQ